MILHWVKNGICLYGTNACGKSTLMKSIGLTLIMAQAGLTKYHVKNL